jgi:hypothetical protein
MNYFLTEVYAILDQTPIRGPIRNYDPSFYDGVEVERYGISISLPICFLSFSFFKEVLLKIMIFKQHVHDSIQINNNTLEIITIEIIWVIIIIHKITVQCQQQL